VPTLNYFGHSDPDNLASFTLDPVEKISWFFREPLTNALNIWSIFPTIFISLTTVGIIIVGLLIELFVEYKSGVAKNQQKKNLEKYFLKIIILGALFILCYLPNLAAGRNAAFYHTLPVLTMVIVLLVFNAIRRFLMVFSPLYKTKIQTGILLIMSIVAMYTAYRNIKNYIAEPCEAEIQHVIFSIKNSDIDNINHIHLIRPRWGLDFNSKRFRYETFGVPSSVYWMNAPGLVTLALSEIGIARERVRGIRITSSGLNDPQELEDSNLRGTGKTKKDILKLRASEPDYGVINIEEPRTLVIDMRLLKKFDVD